MAIGLMMFVREPNDYGVKTLPLPLPLPGPVPTCDKAFQSGSGAKNGSSRAGLRRGRAGEGAGEGVLRGLRDAQINLVHRARAR